MGLCTAHLNSDQSRAERQSILDALAQLDLLLLAPEQLTKSDVLHALRTQCVARVVVDEAHLIPQAGKQFRPAYGDISSFLSALPIPPQVLACTATATKQEQKHILKSLNMQHPKVFSFFTQRKELALSIKQVGGKGRDKQLQALFHAVEQELCSWDGNGAAVIYCPTVSRVKELARWLKGRGFPVLKYTGKQSRKKRQRAQDRFFQGDRKIMVATNAFGTGIDKPDIRLLIHAGLPLSFSGYVQEIGRAGRETQSMCPAEHCLRSCAQQKNPAPQQGRHGGSRGFQSPADLLQQESMSLAADRGSLWKKEAAALRAVLQLPAEKEMTQSICVHSWRKGGQPTEAVRPS